jgi:hypothetical protein
VAKVKRGGSMAEVLAKARIQVQTPALSKKKKKENERKTNLISRYLHNVDTISRIYSITFFSAENSKPAMTFQGQSHKSLFCLSCT